MLTYIRRPIDKSLEEEVLSVIRGLSNCEGRAVSLAEIEAELTERGISVRESDLRSIAWDLEAENIIEFTLDWKLALVNSDEESSR